MHLGDQIERARQVIESLRIVIASRSIPAAKCVWRGADVVIVTQAQPVPAPGSIEAWYGPDREIATKHARELSWVFERLRDGFGDLVDGCSKIELYGRFELAANRCIAAGGADVADITSAVIAEATMILTEMEVGAFGHLTVAPGRMIKADSRARWN